jgi:phage-related minor tail protein
MADNLSVSVTAATSQLRASLALAQADLRAFGAETRQLATSIRSGGDASGVLRGQLEQVASQFNRAESEVAGLTSALRDPTGQAATSFKNLGISLDEVRAHANDLTGLLRLLAERTSDLQPGLQRTAELHELIGRGMDRLVPLLRQGGEGFQELLKAADAYSAALAKNATAMDQSAEKQHKLGLDINTLGVDAFNLLKPLIDDVVGALDGLVRGFDKAIKKVAEWAASTRKAAFDVSNAFYKFFHGQNTSLTRSRARATTCRRLR